MGSGINGWEDTILRTDQDGNQDNPRKSKQPSHNSQLGQDSALILSRETLSITQDTNGMGEGNLQGTCTLPENASIEGGVGSFL